MSAERIALFFLRFLLQILFCVLVVEHGEERNSFSSHVQKELLKKLGMKNTSGTSGGCYMVRRLVIQCTDLY